MNELVKSLKTIKDLENLPAGQRAELINGEIVMMAPAAAKHSVIQSSLIRILAKGKDPRENPTDPESFWLISEAWTFYDAKTVFVHDVAGFYFNKLKTIPEKGPIKEKPFWVCEVMSPGNWSLDTQVKRAALEYFRVPYYWIVDPERRSIQVFELKENSEHYQVLVYAEKDDTIKLAPFLDVELNLAHIFP